MSLSLSFNEFRISPQPPAGIVLPAYVTDIYRVLKQNQEIYERECTGGFVFGGLFTSVYKDQEPRDVDICLFSPGLAAYGDRLAELKAMDAGSYSEREEINETINHLIFHMFPMTQGVIWDHDSLRIKKSQNIGTSIQILCGAETASGNRLVDVIFTARKLSPHEIFARAPICSAAYMFDEDVYCVHKDFEADIKSWRYAPFGAASSEVLDKARSKGMTIALTDKPQP